MAKAPQEDVNVQSIIASLDVLSAGDLNQVIEAAMSKKASKIDQAKRDLIAETKAKAAELGLSFEDLLQGTPKKTETRVAAPIKFRFPSGATWSGRGKNPKELEELIAAGRSKDEFAV